MTEGNFLKNHVKRLAGAAAIGTMAVSSLLAFAPAANAVGGDAQIQTQKTGKILIDTGLGYWYGLKDTNTASTVVLEGVKASYGATEGEARAGASVLTFPSAGSTGRIMNSAGQCLYYDNFVMQATSTGSATLNNGRLRWVACSSIAETARSSGQFSWQGISFGAMSLSFTRTTAPIATWHGGIGVRGTGADARIVASSIRDGSTPGEPTTPDIAALTAEVTSKDQASKTAVVSGTGEPGATIELSGPWGSKTVQVGNDGKWTTPISGLVDGNNPVNVKQTIDGKAYGETNLTVDFEAQTAPLTAKIDSSDPAAKTAVVSGTGQPGATIDLSGDWGTAQVEVGEDGNWSTTIGGLKEGENDVHVTQTVGGEPAGETDLKVTFEASPIVNPAIAGGTAAAALAAAAFLAIRRRKASV